MTREPNIDFDANMYHQSASRFDTAETLVVNTALDGDRLPQIMM